MTRAPRPSDGVYAISVASEMVGTGEQNLRLYERRGLVTPARSDGGTRLYSQDDVDRLRRIVVLLRDEGLNLAGVTMVLDLQDQLARRRQEPRRDVRTEREHSHGESNTGYIRHE